MLTLVDLISQDSTGPSARALSISLLVSKPPVLILYKSEYIRRCPNGSLRAVSSLAHCRVCLAGTPLLGLRLDDTMFPCSSPLRPPLMPLLASVVERKPENRHSECGRQHAKLITDSPNINAYARLFCGARRPMLNGDQTIQYHI